MNKRNDVPDKALTHAGVFHADDVLAGALLTILNPSIQIMRSNAVPEDFDGLVFDIGGGEFDHHGSNKRYRSNGIPYSSFGLLWEQFGAMLLQEEEVRAFDKGLVQPIDLTDNSGAGNPLSLCATDFNPQHLASPSEFDEAYGRALDWARGILQRRVDALRVEREQFDQVRALAAQGDGIVLVLDEPMRWKRALVGSGYEYVVYPSVRGGYNVQCVPIRLGDGSMVRPFPESWRGKPADDLRAITGIQDMVFCHASGFLCAADSLEGALEIARLSQAHTSDSHTSG